MWGKWPVQMSYCREKGAMEVWFYLPTGKRNQNWKGSDWLVITLTGDPWGCDHRKLLKFSIALEQGGLVVKNLPAMQETGRRCRFDPWVRKILWRRKWHTHKKRKWQPTPLFLPGKSHEQRSLAGCSPWDPRVRYDWATKQQSQQNPQSPRLQSKLAAVTSGLSGGGGVCGVGSRMLASSRGSGWSCWWAYFRDLPPRTTGGNVRSGDESEREYFSCKNCKENVRLPSSQLPRSLEWGGGTQWLRRTNEWLLLSSSCSPFSFVFGVWERHPAVTWGGAAILIDLRRLGLHLQTGVCVCVCVCVSHSIMSDSLRPHGL